MEKHERKIHLKLTLLDFEYYTNNLDAEGKQPNRVKKLRPLIKRAWNYLAGGTTTKFKQAMRDIESLISKTDQPDIDNKENGDDQDHVLPAEEIHSHAEITHNIRARAP